MLKLAKPADMTKAEEKYWKEAEEAVEDTYDPEGSKDEKGKFYGTVTNIFKAKVEKHLGYDPFKKKKKDKDKKKKKSELDVEMRAAAYIRRAQDLTSTEVPELAKEDLLPTLERISNEIEDLKSLIDQGFETGDELRAAEEELKTYREAGAKLNELLEGIKGFRNWFSDSRNSTYTQVTGEIPEEG